VTHRIACSGQCWGACLVINPQAQTGSILEHPIGEKNGNPLRSGALLLSMSGGNKTIPPKMQRELKKPKDTSINILTGSIESEALLRDRIKEDNHAMTKVLPSVSNISTNSPRPIQFRSINGTKVLALVLLFVICGLSAVFLLLQ
jgi:hypothetical protein